MLPNGESWRVDGVRERHEKTSFSLLSWASMVTMVTWKKLPVSASHLTRNSISLGQQALKGAVNALANSSTERQCTAMSMYGM
uniref:Uncharacterized protein n=1 Tax=Fagus sylvatica TaxID=28930 RepID=A0A2N9IZM1_FAGSY